MSASNPNSAIYMGDTPNQIKNKINRHAFSGGGDTEELHRQNGGNPDVDVAFRYLSFFEEDDEKLAKVAADYRAGTLLTGQLKALCIKAIQEEVAAFQKVGVVSACLARAGADCQTILSARPRSLASCCSPTWTLRGRLTRHQQPRDNDLEYHTTRCYTMTLGYELICMMCERHWPRALRVKATLSGPGRHGLRALQPCSEVSATTSSSAFRPSSPSSSTASAALLNPLAVWIGTIAGPVAGFTAFVALCDAARQR